MKKKLKCFFGGGWIGINEQIERATSTTSRMNVGIKTQMTEMTLKTGKRVLIEEDVPQYWFPPELWDTIKGFWLDPTDIHLAKRAVYRQKLVAEARELKFYWARYSKGVNDKLRNSGLTFAELAEQPRWKKTCLQICEAMKRNADKQVKLIEDNSENIMRTSLEQTSRLLNYGISYTYLLKDAYINQESDLETIRKFYEIYNKLKN